MAGVERGMIRLYHKHVLIMQMSHSLHSQLTPSIINVISSSVLKNVMSYMFVFEVYIPIVVSS